MMWLPETTILGEEPAREFSLYHPGHHLWVVVGEDGGVAFSSEHPVSLRLFFLNDPEVGTEDFASSFLGWLRVESVQPTSQLKLYPACTPEEAYAAQVFSFAGSMPVVEQTGLEFNRDFRPNVGTMFEVRGTPFQVDAWTALYLREFPVEEYGTKVWFQPDRSSGSLKTIRVFRQTTFD